MAKIARWTRKIGGWSDNRDCAKTAGAILMKFGHNRGETMVEACTKLQPKRITGSRDMGVLVQGYGEHKCDEREWMDTAVEPNQKPDPTAQWTLLSLLLVVLML